MKSGIRYKYHKEGKAEAENCCGVKFLSGLVKISPLILCVVGIIYLVLLFNSKFMEGSKIEEHKILIELTSSNDLLTDSTSYNIKQMKALIKELENQELNINNKYDLLIKARENESNTIQYLSCIVAILIGLGAFYGIKNSHDIEQKINEFAKDEVKIAVNKQISNDIKARANFEVRKMLRGEFVKAVEEGIYRSIITKWGENIEDRISALEQKNGIEEENEESHISDAGFKVTSSTNTDDTDDVAFDNETNNPQP